MEVFFSVCHAISRVLSLSFLRRGLIIYLALALPPGSSGSYDTQAAGTLMLGCLLAADRVYHFVQSPA